jgi:hypothetical protein
MRKIIVLVAASILMVGEALAFNNFGHQTIAALADKYLTDNARQEVKAILKTDMVKASTWLNTLRKKPELAHTKDWHFTTLDANGKSTTMDENDGIVQLEKAIAVLRDRANQSDSLVQASLRNVIHLVGDLHCISHIRIEGNEATKGFTYKTWNELTAEGKGFYSSKTYDSSWYKLWESKFAGRYNLFTPQYYGDDIDIYANAKKAEYEKGTPRFWAENTGEDVVRALESITPGAVVPTQILQLQEFNHTKCMAKASYRLAALLNEIFK